MLLYNQNSEDYGIFDAGNPNSDWILGKGGDMVDNTAYLSLFDHTQLEQMLQKRELGVEMLSLRGKLDVLESFETVTMSTFSVQGGWGEYKITPAETHGFYASSTGLPGNLRNEGVGTLLQGHFREGSQWANDVNIYEDQIDNLLNHDSLVIRKDGHLNRIPGMDFLVMTTKPVLGPEQLAAPGGS